MEEIRITRLRLDRKRPGRYARSFMAPDGTIHLMGVFRVVERGSVVEVAAGTPPPWGVANLLESKINTFFVRPGCFLGLGNMCRPAETRGQHLLPAWRSSDDLETLERGEARLIVPEAGNVDYGDGSIWSGLVCHRSVVEAGDGSLLAAMYGNFEQDTSRPTHPWSRTETKFRPRAFVARSTDQGATWSYVSSVAVPDHDKPDDTEGFNEWSMARLEDGRLLGVIRTGHFSPLVACWSGDDGRTWTAPRNPPGLGPGGCDPNLVRLQDGRLALAYGEMVQPPEDSERYWSDFDNCDRRRRCRLALSADKTGDSWTTIDISDYDDRSAYATIFEVEPNVILYQADLELWRVGVPPAGDERLHYPGKAGSSRRLARAPNGSTRFSLFP